jgi:uncharacterized protein (TIGR00251 family)
MGSALELKDDGEGVGVTLKVKVKPKAKRDALMGVRGDTLFVSVTAPPEKGKANRAVIGVLARALKLPKSAIEIVAGETYPEKVIYLRGLTVNQVKERLSL